jgi:hypothetical protein
MGGGFRVTSPFGVRNAVKRNWITEAEFEVITGNVYE